MGNARLHSNERRIHFIVEVQIVDSAFTISCCSSHKFIQSICWHQNNLHTWISCQHEWRKVPPSYLRTRRVETSRNILFEFKIHFVYWICNFFPPFFFTQDSNMQKINVHNNWVPVVNLLQTQQEICQGNLRETRRRHQKRQQHTLCNL